MKNIILAMMGLVFAFSAAQAAEWHVAVQNGSDSNAGTKTAPFKTIQAAANVAQPGDVITVHAGVYRERVNPPRGGTSDKNRIVYQAAKGEKVTITGSEPVKGWEKVGDNTWKVVIPNKYFGNFNPYVDLIRGDWFDPRGRQHHTGSVYLNGDGLVEATTMEDVLKSSGKDPLWYAQVDGAGPDEYLLNIAWFKAGTSDSFSAMKMSAKNGTQPVPCAEGGQAVGYIASGNWLRYDDVDFGAESDRLELRVASTAPCEIEIRQDGPDGKLLGTVNVPATGDWQKWVSVTADIVKTSGKKNLCFVFTSPRAKNGKTTIWAQFPGVNPNESNVEINVRRTVFTPAKTGINYITVRGFILRNAATNWAPPTAGQIGLITAYWCKGWIIEDNDIAYSKCVAVALGKYCDEYDNTSANTADGYVKTIERALGNGWNKATIGSHIVRNNTIHHCEQAGIVGSLGCSFSTITGNEIHDIHVHRLFGGAEMGAIKFHGAVDVVISGNHIYRTCRGIWLDWMGQGARISRNLLHDNGPQEDLFLEVNHGPILVDNNISLSDRSLNMQSQGSAFVHNLMCGTIFMFPFDGRQTPFMKPHSTEIVGLHNNPSGDDRFYNNIFCGKAGMSGYNGAVWPVQMEGNVFLDGAKPSAKEKNPLVKPEFDPGIALVKKPEGWYLELTLDKACVDEQKRPFVTTDLLGKAKIPDMAYENRDGTALKVNIDYLGKKRSRKNPFPGPFKGGENRILDVKVW